MCSLLLHFGVSMYVDEKIIGKEHNQFVWEWSVCSALPQEVFNQESLSLAMI